MARPEKRRRVCFRPQYTEFLTKNGDDKVKVTLTVEEYEAIRLIDYLGFTQEQCAKKMGVSRGIVQHLYFDARRKLAQFLVDGIGLQIDGGFYSLCDGLINCGMPDTGESNGVIPDFGDDFKIVMPRSGDETFKGDFNEATEVYLFEISGDKVVSKEILPVHAGNTTEMVIWLTKLGVNAVFAFQMGLGYRNAFREAGLFIYLGMDGEPDDIIRIFLENRLSCNKIVNCRYHVVENVGNKHKNCARFGGYCLLK